MVRILLIVTLFFSSMCMCAQIVKETDGKEITLVVTGKANTEHDATLNALRSAIEQTFGTFISSNTSILNDELVKDEIVSVSRGNIKKYNLLSSSKDQDGIFSVTVSATVSISQLISYAQAKGASTEFDGQSFMMNLKMEELRRKNTLEALNNLYTEVQSLIMDAFDYEIEIQEPVLRNQLGVTPLILAKAEIRTFNYFDYRKVLGYTAADKYKEDFFEIPIKVKIYSSPRTSHIYDIIINTLKNLSLDQAEIEQKINNSNYRDFAKLLQKEDKMGRRNGGYRLPVKEDSIFEYEKKIKKLILYSLMNFDLENIESGEKSGFLYAADIKEKDKVLDKMFSTPLYEAHIHFVTNDRYVVDAFACDVVSNLPYYGRDKFEWDAAIKPGLNFGFLSKLWMPKHDNPEWIEWYIKKDKKKYKKNGELKEPSRYIFDSNERKLCLTYKFGYFIPKKDMNAFKGLRIVHRVDPLPLVPPDFKLDYTIYHNNERIDFSKYHQLIRFPKINK